AEPGRGEQPAAAVEGDVGDAEGVAATGRGDRGEPVDHDVEARRRTRVAVPTVYVEQADRASDTEDGQAIGTGEARQVEGGSLLGRHARGRRVVPAPGQRDVDVAPAVRDQAARVVEAGRDRREVVDPVLVTVTVAVTAAVAVGAR